MEEQEMDIKGLSAEQLAELYQRQVRYRVGAVGARGIADFRRLTEECATAKEALEKVMDCHDNDAFLSLLGAAEEALRGTIDGLTDGRGYMRSVRAELLSAEITFQNEVG